MCMCGFLCVCDCICGPSQTEQGCWNMADTVDCLLPKGVSAESCQKLENQGNTLKINILPEHFQEKEEI